MALLTFAHNSIVNVFVKLRLFEAFTFMWSPVPFIAIPPVVSSLPSIPVNLVAVPLFCPFPPAVSELSAAIVPLASSKWKSKTFPVMFAQPLVEALS